jgi:molecular chaperone DnaK
MNKLIFGIDLGTTNSALAVYIGNKAEIIPVDGNPTFPSVVEFKPNRVITGMQAYRHKGQPNVVYSAKRDMGTDKVYHLELSDGTTKDVTPVDVAAEVLKGIKEKANKSYGEIEDVVITVPAYFNHAQRDDTLKAAKLAGLNCLKIINEPTAASLAYGLDVTESEEVIVIDVGGGTTDITTVAISNIDKVHPILEDVLTVGKSFDITATGGNNLLGGDDYNRYMYDAVIKRTSRDFGVAEEVLREYFPAVKIIPEIENWKLNSGNLILQKKAEIDGKEVSLTFISDYKEICMEKFWNNINQCIKECLTVKRIGTDGKVSEVSQKRIPTKCLLVGGSTKNELLVDCIREFYKHTYRNTEIMIPPNSFADYAVALGAAVQGAILNNTTNGVIIKELNPLPIGVEHSITINGEEESGHFYTMIPKDAPIPAAHSEIYYTSYDNQDSLIVNVYQGTSDRCKYNLLLGSVKIEDLEKKPAGEVSVCLTFSIDINGMLVVEVDYNGRKVKADIKSVLNKDDSVKKLSKRDEAVIKRINLVTKFIKSTGKYTEAIDEFEAWEVGSEPTQYMKDFLKKHRKEIDDFNREELTHLFSNPTAEEDDAEDMEEEDA